MEDGKASDRPLCGACNEPITDSNHIVALDKTFHSEHFVCEHCKEQFPDGVFFAHEGKPYCRRHHLSLFCAKCHGCGEPVESGVELEGKTYHEEHFVCKDCGLRLRDEPEVQLAPDGLLYCAEHFHAAFAPKCQACNTALEGAVVQALGFSFHQACFKCHACDTLLTEFCDRDNFAYCAPCFTEKFAPKARCSACGDEIPHKSKMEAFEMFWHKECLKCAACDVVFSSTDTMFNVAGKLYCEKHYLATLDQCYNCVQAITGDFFTVAAHKYHKHCLTCALCEMELSPEKLWQRDLDGHQELVCEEHSRGPLTAAAVERVVAARLEREARRAAKEESVGGVHSASGKMAAVHLPTASAAGAGGGGEESKGSE